MLNFKEILSFTLVAMLPALCLLVSIVQLGPWPYISLGLVMFAAPIGDRLLQVDSTLGKVNHTAKILPYALFGAHLILLPLGIWAIAHAENHIQRLVFFLAFGLFLGITSFANGHELIHRRDRMSFNMGRLIFISLLFGHHVSAHLLIHHRYAGSSKDPSTAKIGQSLYNFIIKAWVRSYIRGRRAENMRRYSAGRLNRVHPYSYYVGGAVLCLTLVYSILGASGVIAYIALSCFASSQLLLIDYVQHYGLIRKTDRTGKLEKIDHHHSWNAPFFYSSRMTLNAPNHSDHHTNPSKPYYDLTSRSDIPMLPHSMTIMAVCALIPSLWFKMMNHRAMSWR